MRLPIAQMCPEIGLMSMNAASCAKVVVLAQKYLREESDAAHRQQIQGLLDAAAKEDQAAKAELLDRLDGFLQFGTAGLRAKIEAGYRRFNRVSIARATWALGQYLLAAEHASQRSNRQVVIGFDARRQSFVCAEESVSVLVGLGFNVHLFTEVVPTPLCAFAVTELGASAGIMITASHNPPEDNGFKVYGEDGAQLTASVNEKIERLIEQSPSIFDMDRPDVPLQMKRKMRFAVGMDVYDSYFKKLSQSKFHSLGLVEPVKIVYTPLHGVGKKFALRALNDAGFRDVHVVESQADPDGNFPTLQFPNPEEEGVLDEAIKLALKVEADLVLANDPDADRLAVLIRDPVAGTYCRLSGNEIGVLLGADAIFHASTKEKRKLVLSTLVSSQMLSKIALVNGVSYTETQTGFANIAHAAIDREQQFNEQFIFGYEEALGYCVGNVVRDKDGISAAVRFAELYANLRANNRTVFDELDRLALHYGLFRNLQWSLRFEGLTANSQMRKLMKRLRDNPDAILKLNNIPISKREDYLSHSNPSNIIANILVYYAGENIRVIIRPSGTEPKIKFYVEMNEKVDGQNIASHKAKLDQSLEAIRNDLNRQLDH